MRRKEPATSAGSASGEWTPIFRPHRLWSFPGVATARAEMTGPSPSCLGNQAAAECTSSPVGRHGALLAASRARSSRPHGRNGMLWTRPTSGRRCAAPATLQWIAQRRVARVTPHAEPRRGARRETERELLAITFKILPHTPPASTWVCPRHIAGDTRPLCAARGAHRISPPPGREFMQRLTTQDSLETSRRGYIS